MATVLVPLAQGCEELEAVTIMDLLVRAGVTVISAGLDDKPIIASRGTVLIANTTINKVKAAGIDMIVLPGGLPGADNLNHDPYIKNLITQLNENNKLIAAICAAPKVLATLGLLNAKKATAYPGVLEELNIKNLSLEHNQAVVKDGNIITSRGPGTAMDFALELISILCGSFKRNEVATGLQQMKGATEKSYNLLQQENKRLSLIAKTRTDELQQANAELDSFCYSISHDLQGPLARLDGFTQLLQSDCKSIKDEETLENVLSVRKNVDNLSVLINSLLAYSRAGRMELTIESINLTKIVNDVIENLQFIQPQIHVDWKITKNITVDADYKMMTIVIEKLLNNAFKYSSKIDNACIEFSTTTINEQLVYFVRDNGAGFNMKHADKLFGVFQRMHNDNHFEGVGIDLAIVQRLIQRQRGSIWAEAEIDNGATFYFVLG